MLHILLLILKIIGIILAVILGILVLLVCIVVFVPVRYEAKVRCGGALDTLKGKVRVTWLLRLVRVDVYYKENKLKWRIRIAWKKIIGGDNGYTDKNTEKDVKEDENQEDQEKNISKEREKAWQVEEVPPGEKAPAVEKTPEDEKASEDEKVPEDEKIPEGKTSECEKAWAVEKVFKGSEKGSEEDQHESETDQGTGKIKRSVQKVIEKIKGIYNKIKCTIQGICDKIKELSEKKDKVLGFIEDETHVGAFLKLKKEVFKLLRKLKPKKLQIQAVFGFDDPANTGYTLAFLSILYPSFGDHIAIRPDFEKRVLDGSLYVKGHIRLCHFIVLAWNLLWCKNIRRTYRDIRNFEL